MIKHQSFKTKGHRQAEGNIRQRCTEMIITKYAMSLASSSLASPGYQKQKEKKNAKSPQLGDGTTGCFQRR
jgi:hypothetical protein